MNKKQRQQVVITPTANQIYNDIIGSLINADDMSIGDKHLLMIYAVNLDLFNIKLAEVAESGGVQTFPNGAQQVSPNYTIMRNAQADLMKISSLLGFNTATRARLKIADSIPIGDPMDEI